MWSIPIIKLQCGVGKCGPLNPVDLLIFFRRVAKNARIKYEVSNKWKVSPDPNIYVIMTKIPYDRY